MPDLFDLFAEDEEAALAAERERQRLATVPGTPQHAAALADAARWEAGAARWADLDLTEADEADDEDDEADDGP